MVRISTFVFFDIETTGLPYQEQNRTKITELSLIAIDRRDMRSIKNQRNVRQISKLTFVLNPRKNINPVAASITGLTNNMLNYAPTFEEKFEVITTFLESLKQPVCLVAHNGNIFDYKILLAECNDANVELPEDILCADSLPGFRKLLQNRTSVPLRKSLDASWESILTDDGDEGAAWPDFNVTPEEFKEIDELSSSLSELSCEEPPKKLKPTPKKIKSTSKNAKVTHTGAQDKCKSFKLIDIYKKLFNETPENAHRAEDDCFMLLECVAACQNPTNEAEDFLHWLDNNCKMLNLIPPLKRK